MAKVTGVKKSLSEVKAKIIKKAAAGLKRDAYLIENEIVFTIFNGQSPVLGERFKQYSKPYADIFKSGNLKPVNMFLTGEMLDSLTLTKAGSGILILFKSKIAAFHDKLGAGKSRVIRRLLPRVSEGETFKSNILAVIRKIVKRAIKN